MVNARLLLTTKCGGLHRATLSYPPQSADFLGRRCRSRAAALGRKPGNCGKRIRGKVFTMTAAFAKVRQANAHFPKFVLIAAPTVTNFGKSRATHKLIESSTALSI
jgi:hypothetical protein